MRGGGDDGGSLWDGDVVTSGCCGGAPGAKGMATRRREWWWTTRLDSVMVTTSRRRSMITDQLLKSWFRRSAQSISTGSPLESQGLDVFADWPRSCKGCELLATSSAWSKPARERNWTWLNSGLLVNSRAANLSSSLSLWLNLPILWWSSWWCRLEWGARAATSLRRHGHTSGYEGREFGHRGLAELTLFSRFSLSFFFFSSSRSLSERLLSCRRPVPLFFVSSVFQSQWSLSTVAVNVWMFCLPYSDLSKHIFIV